MGQHKLFPFFHLKLSTVRKVPQVSSREDKRRITRSGSGEMGTFVK